MGVEGLNKFLSHPGVGGACGGRWHQLKSPLSNTLPSPVHAPSLPVPSSFPLPPSSLRTRCSAHFSAFPFNADECGDPHYRLVAMDQICSSGELTGNGPSWPSALSSDEESKAACAAACNARACCTHYTWFEDKGCRTYSACSSYSSGLTGITEYTCERIVPGVARFHRQEQSLISLQQPDLQQSCRSS